MKENSISYKTAKQETERLICEIEEITITAGKEKNHRRSKNG